MTLAWTSILISIRKIQARSSLWTAFELMATAAMPLFTDTTRGSGGKRYCQSYRKTNDRWIIENFHYKFDQDVGKPPRMTT